MNGIPVNILNAAARPTHVPMYSPELFYRPIRQQGQVGKPAAPAPPTTIVPSSTATKPSPTEVKQPKMPDLLPLKSMISSSSSTVSESSSTKSKSKLRLVRPWEQRKRDIEVVNVDEDYDDEPEVETEDKQETMEQEYVPLKKRRMIMYELDCNYSHIKFGNCL